MQDIGQHFIVGLSGTTLTAEEARLLQQLQPFGIILFAHNIDKASATWPSALLDLKAQVATALGRDDFMFSVDHEGGLVQRLPFPLSHFRPALHWKDQASAIGAVFGQELSRLGINTNFAPVLDVWTQTKNTVIAERAFGQTPEDVIAYALAFLSSMEVHGVIGCVKHFPGHGDTVADSHFELPVVHKSREELERCELLPFRAALEQGVRLLMTAHVHYPALDPRAPATLSRPILQGLLRDELGYAGPVVSDALEMRALAHVPPTDVACQAISAGVDLLLSANTKTGGGLTVACKMAQELQRRATSDTELRKALAVSAERLESLQSDVSVLSEYQPKSFQPLTLAAELQPLLKV